MKYTLAHIEDLVARAACAGLDGTGFLADFTHEELVREYNGIGPEYLPPRLRGKITELLAVFEPAALIHDLRNFRSDGSRYHFNYANGEFLANCLALANDAYPWWSWRRYRARRVAHLLYDFVQSRFGWKAWQDCFNKNPNMKKDGQE